MNDLIIIVHFIGLALFSTSVPNEPGLRVLLPRVASHVHSAEVSPEPDDGTAIDTTGTTRDIEAHRTFIVYDHRDFRGESGWTSEDLPAHLIRANAVDPPRYRFVPLNGERLTFFTGMTENLRGTAESLPTPTCGDIVDKSKAAAIVNVFKGTVSTCGATMSRSTKRYDTRLVLKGNRDLGLEIKAQLGDQLKTLRLAATAPVYIVNMPERMFADQDATPTGSALHYLAYYDLIGMRCGEQSLEPSRTTSTTVCPVAPLLITGEPATSTELAQMIVDSNCSNSSWP